MPALIRLLAGTCSALALGLVSLSANADACSAEAREAGWTPPEVLDASGAALDLDTLVSRLASRQVVLLGELHDRYEHHLNQLELICRLRAHGPLAIGLEFFDTSVQHALDTYVHRHGDLDRLLRESRWFERWGFDPRHYAPILRHARTHRIALVALNVPGELVRKVARGGMDALGPDARASLPASVLPPSARYRERLREAYALHPGHAQRDFEHFLAAQSLWDEGMAQRAAEHLLAHPAQRLVVLAGEAHVAPADAIPQRLSRRVPASLARVLHARDAEPVPGALDFQLRSTPRDLPAAGRLGVSLEPGPSKATISGFGEHSAARDAGLRAGDQLIALDGRRVANLADLRLALWSRRPGDAVLLRFARGATEQSMMFALR